MTTFVPTRGAMISHRMSLAVKAPCVTCPRMRPVRKMVPLHHPQQALLDDTMVAVVGKILANTITYPVESIRMWTISNTPMPWTLANLFTGYNIYLPYTLANNICTFFLFYAIEAALLAWIPANSNAALLGTSVLTCLITSCYKVPVSYTLKRKVVHTELRVRDLMNPFYLFSAYRAMILEDIPELFLKFYLRNYLAVHYVTLAAFWKALIIGLVTTVLLAPLELYKTRILCEGIAIESDPRGVLLRAANSILNTFIFFLFLDTVAVIKI